MYTIVKVEFGQVVDYYFHACESIEDALVKLNFFMNKIVVTITILALLGRFEMSLYKTLYPIKSFGLTIPPNTIVRLAFLSEVYDSYGYFAFLGIYVGLSKLIKMSDVTPVEVDEVNN